MLQFHEGYFEGESLSDFYVESMMKRAWAAELEVLAEIIRVCKKYHITYYADWGTLLGAVRHQGFIPWDDDIDIALKRKDYMRLLQVLPGEMPEGWSISSYYTSESHRQPLSCVMNSTRVDQSPEFLSRYHGCPYIVGVDVCPLDTVPRDPELAETQRLLYSAVYDAAGRFEELEKSGELQECLPRIEELCNVRLDRSRPLRRQLCLLGDQICAMFGEEEGDVLSWFPIRVYRDAAFGYPKQWYEDTVELPFEMLSVTAPAAYHEVLATMFGEEYMTPRRTGGGHAYPFYRVQEPYLKQI